jgi:hypothetical protein
MENVVVIFVLFLFWEFHISWVVVFIINPSIYIELVTFSILEWLATFSFVICIYFVSFDEAVETNSEVVQSAATLHYGMLVQNIMWYL